MKNILGFFMACFLFSLTLGCEGISPVENSSGASSTSGVVLTVQAVPQTVDIGGTSIITVTATYSVSASPASGIIVAAVSGSTGNLSALTGTTDSNGQATFTIIVNDVVSVVMTYEDTSVFVRINVI